MSLVSSSSATSFLGTVKKPNGLGLKRSTSHREGPAPEELLEKLLGTKLADGSADGDALHSITEADLELDFDHAGLSLKELAATGPSDAKPASPRRPQARRDCEPRAPILCSKSRRFANPASVVEDESTALEVLHNSIVECDDVLNSVETNFASFRNDLAAVSADIESLQSRSTLLNARLENRKTVGKALGPVIDEISVSPETVSRVVECPMDESWLRALGDIDKRATAYRKTSAGSNKSKAWSDLGPLLENLILKVWRTHLRLFLHSPV